VKKKQMKPVVPPSESEDEELEFVESKSHNKKPDPTSK
jgi:hypothetical protein